MHHAKYNDPCTTQDPSNGAAASCPASAAAAEIVLGRAVERRQRQWAVHAPRGALVRLGGGGRRGGRQVPATTDSETQGSHVASEGGID